MQPLNTFDTKAYVDYDNLNITILPRPPRRRQSGKSLVPFRPYVKRLVSVRQPFSFTNGYDKWKIVGKDEAFFTQPNARCIGSLIDDCDISDVIRWDIEGESTRLPMMCKLWMIVDGAVVERGRPHLVQDAAVQVLIEGRNLRSVLSAQQQYHKQTSDRRRRQSWHDVNEYHSVSYYQYTHTVQSGHEQAVQCNIDYETLESQQEILSDLEEESVDEDQMNDLKEEKVKEIIHNISIPQDRVHISMMTQTESRFMDRSTSIDSQLIQMFNLNLETNEILLSSIVNPYFRAVSSDHLSETISFYRNGIRYKHQAVSTGDDYPHWWLRLTTDLILSDYLTNQSEEKEKILPPPSPRLDQSVQTDDEKPRPTTPLRISKTSSSVATSNHYQLIDEIDDGNNAKRHSAFSDNSQRVDSHADIDSHSSDYQIENSSIRGDENLDKHPMSSKQSETDYNAFVFTLNQQQQQSYSTPDHHTDGAECHYLSNETIRVRPKSSHSPSTSLLSSLLERYEQTLRDRQRAITIVNDELLDIDDVLKRYREKAQNCSPIRSSTAMELYRDISLLSVQSKEDRPSLIGVNLTKSKYRSMAGITSEDMIQGYIPSSRLCITNSLITSPRQRQPRFEIPSIRPDYCDLCLTGHHTSSAWIRYNERRIEDVQKRIDLMLQIDDNEEAQLLLTPTYQTSATVTQRIDDILLTKSQHRSPLFYHHDRLLSPHRYQFRLPHRLNHSLPNSPRILSRHTTRSTTPIPKSVRISTQSVVPPRSHSRQSTSASRPIVSILRRSSVPATPRSPRLVESPHIWQSNVDGKVYALEQFSIPRYYRLYNDVGFREMYNFSRVLDTYMDPNRPTTTDYSSMVKNFALEQQLPSSITSAA